MDQEIWHEPDSVRDAAVAWGLVSRGFGLPASSQAGESCAAKRH